jgi:hypothetical protein
VSSRVIQYCQTIYQLVGLDNDEYIAYFFAASISLGMYSSSSRYVDNIKVLTTCHHIICAILHASLSSQISGESWCCEKSIHGRSHAKNVKAQKIETPFAFFWLLLGDEERIAEFLATINQL